MNSGLIDVLVFDFLAETTMAILVGAQRKNPAAGYATENPAQRRPCITLARFSRDAGCLTGD